MARKNRKKIKNRAPYEIPAPSDYRFSTAKFIKRVELRLKRKNAELEHLGIDPKNREEYLNSIIETEFAAMLRKYKKMYNSDCVRLENAIERRKIDKEDYSNLLSDISIEIGALSAEYIAIEKLYKEKCNPLYKGQLRVQDIIDEEPKEFTDGDDADE